MNAPAGQVEQAFNQEMGSRIACQRKQHGFSQIALAFEIGVHRNTLMRWEDGGASLPTWMLLRIAYVLRISHLVLLPDRDLVWGTALEAAIQERDPVKGVQSERDPQLQHRDVA